VRTCRTLTPARGAVAALLLAAGAGLAAAPAAADPDRPAMPSREQVEQARDRAAQTAGDVAEIKARLALANQELERAAVAAEQAAEAWNGARWELEQANAALAAARKDAARARRELSAQREVIGALVASSYQQATEITGLNAMMSAEGPEGVLDQYVAFQGASTSMQADYERYAAGEVVAQGFAVEARRARAHQQEVARLAAAARDRASDAAQAAQSAAATIAEDKDRLVRELARAQGISVSLARQRQSALEEIARQRAAERAAAEAAAAARQQAREQARREAAEQAAERAAARREKVRERADRPEQRRDPAPAPQPAPQPPPQPAPQPAPAPAPPARGGVSAVIGFAKQQVGEPYQWGAAGPDAWDCSGLTMRAWERAGVSLPHYSVAQYDAGTPVTAGQLRPGDLVFWSSSSSPSGIHHVALYAGDGMIVHAPRTGRPVAVESMYYWVPPTHFVRV
jgi:peptidoglycan DL-endopeptidase CwlO